MTAVEFFLYCAGSGTLLVSFAAAARLVRQPVSRQRAAQPRWEPVPEQGDPNLEGLAKRLQQVQHARYASPIVYRELPVGAGPQQRVIVPARLRSPQGEPPKKKG